MSACPRGLPLERPMRGGDERSQNRRERQREGERLLRDRVNVFEIWRGRSVKNNVCVFAWIQFWKSKKKKKKKLWVWDNLASSKPENKKLTQSQRTGQKQAVLLKSQHTQPQTHTDTHSSEGDHRHHKDIFSLGVHFGLLCERNLLETSRNFIRSFIKSSLRLED